MTDRNQIDDDGSNGIQDDEFALLVNEHINSYIRLADNKASILLSALVAYLGISLGVLGSLWSGGGTFFQISSSLTVLTALLAVYYSASAVYPKTPETPQGLILWDSIAKRTREEYLGEIKNRSDEQLLEELIDENYMLAKVSVEKYSQVRSALICTGVTVALALATVIGYIM